MPASNRRPLYDGADAPQASDISTTPTPQRDPAPAFASSPTPAAAAFAAQQASFKQPCTLKGAASAVYAGALGYFLGFVPATIKFKARQWGMIHTQGLASAQQLAIMSGMYTAVHCICQRIRMVEDGWNRGIAGCSTGLVLGWSNGPWSALQSCAGLGLISALIDLGGGVEAAEARTLQPLQHVQHYTHLLHSTDSQQQGGVKSQHQSNQQPQRMQPIEGWAQGIEDLQGTGSAQALAGLPQPAQLLALLMGASPHSISAAAAPMRSNGEQQAASIGSQGLDTKQRQQEHQAQQHKSKRSRKQQAQQRRIDIYEPSDSSAQMQQQQQQQALQYHLQQPMAAAALLMQPATRAVQQLMSAPPLMFLGACCSSNVAASAAPAHSFAAAADADIDGCPLAVAPAATATTGNRRK